MAPLILEGDTLGKRHQHYNYLLKDAIAKAVEPQKKIDSNDTEIENLLKIDVANNNRNVEYILEVLISDDMLYVSRAIKNLNWLITDKQYSHLINPNYLHSHLLPKMSTKAIGKLMLHVRLSLKDEKRAEDFYKHFKEYDMNMAVKWLPYCSAAFIAKEIENDYDKIKDPMTDDLIKRICEKSITILKLVVDKSEYRKRDILKATSFLLNSETDKYLDIVESIQPYQVPYFSAKSTAIVMMKCPDRIINKFENYADKLHTKTFARHLKKEEIKNFLIKQTTNKELQSWFRFDNLKFFVPYLPKEGRFDFLKKVFIEKSLKSEESGDAEESDMWVQSCSMALKSSHSTNASIYRWYRFAPFEIAFLDIKKLIRAESAPNERIAMFGVLLDSAGKNKKHIHTLLQYYHDKHINEPFKFKIQFVNQFLSQTDTHTFNDNTWSLLNNLFCSMDVYIESENNVQSCIRAIIAFKILHNKIVPEIIEKKFVFDTLKSFSKKLNKEDQQKMFDYLYNILKSKIENKRLTTETEINDVIGSVDDFVSLLVDWKKNLTDCPWILEKIKEIIKVKSSNSWNVDLVNLYTKQKQWRRTFFEESLLMNPSEEVCLNALKHDPLLLTRYQNKVDALCRDDNVSMRRLLRKIRIYYQNSLANDWASKYFSRLEELGSHAALVRGMCALLPAQRVLDIAQKYAPTQAKINWSEEDERVLSLRKHLARNIYQTRPPPPPKALMRYARGDYLQFALPSVNSILYTMSSEQCRKQIPQFLNAPVSLQKHGIRVAFKKLESTELKHIFADSWKATKNATIRAVLFEQTFELLKGEKNCAMIEEIWELLSTFIDHLSQEENKIIVDTLGKVNLVPLKVRAKFCMKSYKYLKSLPAKANCEIIINNVIDHMRDIMEYLDGEFVAEILLENLDMKFTTKVYNHTHIITAYLMGVKDEATQIKRYEKILAPLLERSIALWKVKLDGSYRTKNNITELLKQLQIDFTKFVLERNMVFPKKMFEQIQNILEKQLPLQSNYTLLRSWKLSTALIKLLKGHSALALSISEGMSPSNGYWNDTCSNKKFNALYIKVSQTFAETCIRLIKDDIQLLFPTVHLFFANALSSTFSDMGIHQMGYFGILKCMLENKEFVESYLVVLKVLPRHFFDGDEDRDVTKEIRKVILAHPSVEVKMHYYEKYGNDDFDD